MPCIVAYLMGRLLLVGGQVSTWWQTGLLVGGQLGLYKLTIMSHDHNHVTLSRHMITWITITKFGNTLQSHLKVVWHDSWLLACTAIYWAGRLLVPYCSWFCTGYLVSQLWVCTSTVLFNFFNFFYTIKHWDVREKNKRRTKQKLTELTNKPQS